jgi:hypothetical protein
MTEPDFRALCDELIDEWDAILSQDQTEFAAAMDRARAALSQPAPEPKTVAEYYVIEPDGIETFDTREAAKAHADTVLREYQANASSDGWPEDMEVLSWGEMRPIQTVEECDRQPPDPEFHDSSWDFVCNYRWRQGND